MTQIVNESCVELTCPAAAEEHNYGAPPCGYVLLIDDEGCQVLVPAAK